MRQRDLITLFDYMYWAHRKVLASAARLTDAQFTLPSVIAGRDLRATLVHTLDVEMSWRRRLQRRPEDEWRKALPISDYRNVATLADHWTRDEGEMREWVASLDDETLGRSADLDAEKTLPLWYFLLHMVTHSQQHRSESAQLLTQLGRSPGDVDFLDYCDQRESR
ncbi:MAG: DinB family protein [Chloroflexota bacterium]|nr:DinB family protein [Chloroflexota bacterium]